MHPTLQCPSCGSSYVGRSEIISGERGWRCQECGHVWEADPPSAEPDVPPA
jgi:predicted Zn finger-like uncharacterized protein